MRPGSMIEAIFYDIASAEEIAVLDKFYEKRNFGGAETYCLRRIIKIWIRLVNMLTPDERKRYGIN